MASRFLRNGTPISRNGSLVKSGSLTTEVTGQERQAASSSRPRAPGARRPRTLSFRFGGLALGAAGPCHLLEGPVSGRLAPLLPLGSTQSGNSPHGALQHRGAGRGHDLPTLAPRVTRSSSSCSNVSPIASAAPVPAASRASFEG